ncbi:DUF4190 domain-containing protein [Kitasatospora sp. NPDC050463]|uniref:DUF4190 domain-containing protein n=1 Tax=Kitasatospora sp. NPDC050463 TaxID=3155786 RepID=UPI0033F79FA6
MSKPESDAPVPASDAAASDAVRSTGEAWDAVAPPVAAPDGPAVDTSSADAAPAESVAAGAPEPAERVELTKPTRPDAGPPAPEAAVEPAAPTAAAPAAPADPWAAPGTTAPATPGTTAAPGAVPTADPWTAAGGPVPPGPPPASGWAAVPPGALSGFQPGYAYPAPEVTNGFSVAALVTGLLCMWPLSLAFGIVALVQIPKRNERGRGMAVTGVVLGILGVLVTLVGFLGLLAAGVDASADRPARAPKAPGSVLWSSLKSGDCYNPPGGAAGSEDGDATVLWVLKASCSLPHHGEVAGTARIPEGDGLAYPGESLVRESAATLCGPVLTDYALDYWAVPDGMDEVYLYPSRANWKSGERYATCAYEDRDAEHLGSVRTDRGKLSSAQLTYLEAARAYNTVSWSEPDAEVAEARSDYVSWASRMADASRKEAEQLSKGAVVWPDGAKPKVAELVAAQRDAATVWDTAARTVDATALEREIRRAKALVSKSAKVTVEIRRELGLSTGEQVGEIRA